VDLAAVVDVAGLGQEPHRQFALHAAHPVSPAVRTGT
jgi:hypothetical protein